MTVLDYSGFRPSTAQLQEMKRLGVTAVSRYICPPVPACDWKRCTKAEAQQLRAAGIDLVLNWEWYEGRCLEGAPAGKQDGAWALAAAQQIGYPRGATIIVSHDTSAQNDLAVLNYLRAFALALGGYYRVDVYGSYQLVEMCLNAGVARYGWQTIAWSNGQVGRCHLYQNGKQWFSGNADENQYRQAPIGSWNETVAGHTPDPTPTPKPTPKPTPRPTPQPAVTHTYTVQAGDTLSKIAIDYHTTVSELVRLNRVKHPSLIVHPNLIVTGWVLTLPGAHKPPHPAPAKFYTVHAGDTLSKIATHFHTDVAHLVRWNKSAHPSLKRNPNLIRQGWNLRVAA